MAFRSALKTYVNNVFPNGKLLTQYGNTCFQRWECMLTWNLKTSIPMCYHISTVWNVCSHVFPWHHGGKCMFPGVAIRGAQNSLLGCGFKDLGYGCKNLRCGASCTHSISLCVLILPSFLTRIVKYNFSYIWHIFSPLMKASNLKYIQFIAIKS